MKALTHLRMLLLMALLTAQATIGSAQDWMAHDGAPLKYFPPSMTEALNSGVPMVLELEFAIADTVLLAPRKRNKVMTSFKLSHHALSSRYLVNINALQRPTMFASINALVNFLNAEAQLAYERYCSSNADQMEQEMASCEFRLRLNKNRLPGPLRLMAYLSGDWYLDSGWRSWALEN